jgi:hypothetical protein
MTLDKSPIPLHRQDRIVQAIREGRLLRLTYDGFERTVEPYTYGLDRRGQRLLVAFQVGGGSQSGAFGWKTLRECGMERVRVLATTFVTTRSDYRRDDGAFASIIAQR